MSDELLAGLDGLRTAFHAIDVTGYDDVITVELSAEVGRKFECWLLMNMPDELRFAFNGGRVEVDTDTENPKRYVNLYGVRVMWPTGRIRLGPPGYKVIPRPIPDEVVTLDGRYYPGRVTRIRP